MLPFEPLRRFVPEDFPLPLRALDFDDFLLLDFLLPPDLRALDLLPPFLPRDFVPREALPDFELFALLAPDFFDGFDPPLRLEDFFAEPPEDLLLPADFLPDDLPDRPDPDFFEAERDFPPELELDPAAFPAKAPRTPPTTVPMGPATLPMMAPVAAPAACFEIGGMSRFSEGCEPPDC